MRGSAHEGECAEVGGEERTRESCPVPLTWRSHTLSALARVARMLVFMLERVPGTALALAHKFSDELVHLIR